jgi:hypothetical protein
MRKRPDDLPGQLFLFGDVPQTSLESVRPIRAEGPTTDQIGILMAKKKKPSPNSKPKPAKRQTKAKAKDQPEPSLDPFAPENLRLPQDFAETAGVRKELVKVLCRKPHKSEFVRVRPGEEWRIDMATYEDKIDNIVYMIDRDLISELAESIQYVRVRVAINRQKDLFLWPCRLPGADGRRNQWHDSAHEMAALAETDWVRIVANMGAGMYEPYIPVNSLEDPEWPDHSFRDLLALAFKGNRVDTADHRVLKALRGEI